MYTFSEGTSTILGLLVWLAVFGALFGFNEIGRRFKWIGFCMFVVLPTFLTVLWLTVLKDTAYMDWFHLAKVYSSDAGCIGFWLIRHLEGKRKDGTTWRLADNKVALCFPPLILAINILEAVSRDFQVGALYANAQGIATHLVENNQVQDLLGGPWNAMNGVAGLLNIVTITGWFGITVRKQTKKDGSKDMLWPDMLWFWIIAYDLWNFAYTYNCIPNHSYYAGLALLIAPTICAFTVGKGAWLQHRAQTLAIWCMFAQTFPQFLDSSAFTVKSTNNPTILFIVSFLALASNVAVFAYMIYKIAKTKRNPYASELYVDIPAYSRIIAEGEGRRAPGEPVPAK
jgi:hypothetical protein